MKIHLAYGALRKKIRCNNGIIESINNWLFSYAYCHTDEFKKVMTFFLKSEKNNKHLLLDSGAFTAHSTGCSVNISDYADWVQNTQKLWHNRVDSIRFMTLDVIGDQRQTRKNTEYLLSLGINPIYILTKDATKDDIKYALETYDYLALGGFVKSQKTTTLARINTYFCLWEEHRKTTGQLVKTHLLGLCDEEILLRFPVYSCDMTTWFISTMVYGRIPPNIDLSRKFKKVPKSDIDDGSLGATIYVIREIVANYQRLEKTITKAWDKRGFTWN